MPTEPGVWEPGKVVAPDEKSLARFARAVERSPDNLAAELDEGDIRSSASLMQLDESAWACLADLDTAMLEALARFFTLAEVQLPGWEGGKRSPVIYIVRALKSRDAFSADLRKWIKAKTDNRFLPYGSAL